MKRMPRRQLIIEIARAMKEAEYPNVAMHMCAGFLWSLYPDWYTEWERLKETDMLLIERLTALKLAAAKRDALKYDDTSKSDFMAAGIEKAARYVADGFSGLNAKFDRETFMAIACGEKPVRKANQACERSGVENE
jgi:hypothetical protein